MNLYADRLPLGTLKGLLSVLNIKSENIRDRDNYNGQLSASKNMQQILAIQFILSLSFHTDIHLRYYKKN